MNTPSPTLTRFRIYRTARSREFLCTVAARNQRHALHVARQTWVLPRDAAALEESRFTRQLSRFGGSSG
jgi:hypothetical protein